jgi:ABC-type phosphate transport system substrate-binding protein
MRTKALINPLLVWFMSLACISVAAAQAGGVAVVVNGLNPVTKLNSRELRKIFAGEKHAWSSGIPIKVFVRSPGTRERVVLLKLLGMTESDYKEYWIAQVFRGEAQAEPLALPSNGMQREAVVTYPGAIALVNTQDVKTGMKVVSVEGRFPGDAGYPLN